MGFPKDIDLRTFGHTTQLVGVIYADADPEGRSFLIYFPEERPLLPFAGQHTHVVLDVDGWKELLHQVDTLETEILQKAKDGTVTKAIVRKSQRHMDTVVQWRVFRRDKFKCRYCAADNVPLTVDHVVLWEEGGPTTDENLLTSCKKCNRSRGNMQYSDWLGSPRYMEMSKRLTETERAENIAHMATLSHILRMTHTRSR